MSLADHMIWKNKDALEETRRANHSVARFLKVHYTKSWFCSSLWDSGYEILYVLIKSQVHLWWKVKTITIRWMLSSICLSCLEYFLIFFPIWSPIEQKSRLEKSICLNIVGLLNIFKEKTEIFKGELVLRQHFCLGLFYPWSAILAWLQLSQWCQIATLENFGGIEHFCCLTSRLFFTCWKYYKLAT